MTVTDVLVVGAGPTGLVAAAELARHGARVRIIDRAVVAMEHPRAHALHARTLEIFEDLGVLREVMSRGRRVSGVRIYEGKSPLLRIDMDGLDGPYPFMVSIPQPETEAILTAHLATLGVEIERGVTLTDLSQDDYGVTATLTLPDGATEQLRTPYLVGCDGGRSAAREALGIPFEGSDTGARFALVDVDVEGRLPADESVSILSETGLVFFIPLAREGRFRMMADVGPTTGQGALELSYFQRLVDERVGPGLTLSNAEWATPFEVHQRLARRFAQGRVFLCGDAAHIFSPAGGQNLNAGIHDAYNLAWKLALNIRGVGTFALVDSYEVERRGVAKALIEGTGQTTRLVGLKGALSREFRKAAARLLGGLEPVQRRLADSLGEMRVCYDESPVVEESRASLLEAQWFEDRSQETPTLGDRQGFGAGPAAGFRAPDGQLLDDGRITRLFEILQGPHHTVLLFDGDAATPAGYARMAQIARGVEARFGALVKAWVIVPGGAAPEGLRGVPTLHDAQGEVHRRYGAGAECVYVIRPDGYIGFRSQPIDGARLDAWLGRIFL